MFKESLNRAKNQKIHNYQPGIINRIYFLVKLHQKDFSKKILFYQANIFKKNQFKEKVNQRNTSKKI